MRKEWMLVIFEKKNIFKNKKKYLVHKRRKRWGGEVQANIFVGLQQKQRCHPVPPQGHFGSGCYPDSESWYFFLFLFFWNFCQTKSLFSFSMLLRNLLLLWVIFAFLSFWEMISSCYLCCMWDSEGMPTDCGTMELVRLGKNPNFIWIKSLNIQIWRIIKRIISKRKLIRGGIKSLFLFKKW